MPWWHAGTPGGSRKETAFRTSRHADRVRFMALRQWSLGIGAVTPPRQLLHIFNPLAAPKGYADDAKSVNKVSTRDVCSCISLPVHVHFCCATSAHEASIITRFWQGRTAAAAAKHSRCHPLAVRALSYLLRSRMDVHAVQTTNAMREYHVTPQ